MNEVQQFNLPWSVVGPAIAAAITAAASILLLVLTYCWNGHRERLARRRKLFSKAYAVVQDYKEFPYVIRRRRTGEPEEERIRISAELRRVQSILSFYSAWLMTESPHVHRSFSELLGQLHRVAGKAMHEAWLEPAVKDDSNMNMPDIGLSALTRYELAYLEEVVDHLSLRPRWLRRMFRPK